MDRRWTFSQAGRKPSVGVLLVIGAVATVLSFRYVLAQDGLLLGRIIGLTLSVPASLVVLLGGVWLATDRFSPVEARRIVGWAIAGAAVSIGLAAVGVVYQQARAGAVADHLVVLSWVARAGAIGGFLTGVYDVRNRRRQAAVRESNARFQAIFDASPLALVSIDRNGTVKQWSPAAEELFGWSREEVLGRQYPLVPDECDEEYDEHLQAVNNGEDLVGVETVRERKDGSTIPVEIWSAPMNGGGATGHMIGLADISERKAQERAMAEEREKYSTLVEESNDGIIVVKGGKLAMANQEFADLVGADAPADIEGDGFLQYVAPEYRETVEDRYEARIAGEDPPPRYEIEAYSVDDEPIPVELNLSTVTYDGGVADMAVIRDISERKERERERRLLKRAVEQTELSVMITDHRGDIEYVNPAFETMTGYDAAEVLGEDPSVLKSGLHDDEFYADLWATITDGEVWEAELTNRRKSGELYRVEQSIAPIEVDGEVCHYVAIERDITARERDEQRLNVLNRVLRHNVRNAVTVIKGNAVRLEDAVDDGDGELALETIRGRADGLASAVENARTVETALSTESRVPLDLPSVLETVRDRQADRHPTATIDLDESPDQVVLGNNALVDAIDEAVTNAIEHADRTDPTVEIGAEVRPESNMAEVTVADDGPGIPAHERNVLEAGEEDALRHGSGLGLWMMAWVADSLGGDVSIHERQPRGTVVRFSLPTSDQATTAETALPEWDALVHSQTRRQETD